MSNKIIVESVNDQYIYKYILDEFCQSPAEVEAIDSTLDWIKLDGLSSEKLLLKLQEVKPDLVRAQDTPRIGIIIDFDEYSLADRINFLNEICSKAFELDIDISNANDFKTYTLAEYNLDFELGYCFSGLNGEGELEHILKAIADLKIATHANCLETGWLPCLTHKSIDFKEKDLRKLWIDFYKRYDCLTSKQKGNAGKYTQWNNFLVKHPTKFDFTKDIHELNEIKDFLGKF